MGSTRSGMFVLLLFAPWAGCVPSYVTCDSNEDCVITWDGADAFDPINRDGHAAYCADHEGCACRAEICICLAGGGGRRVATCHRQRCVAVDLEAVGMTECTRDEDCVVADQVCCPLAATRVECDNAAAPASVARVHEGTLRGLVCDPEPSCEPRRPSELVVARCLEGRCGLAGASE